MHFRKILFIILLVLYSVELAGAGTVETYTINPTDDEGINNALERGGIIYLNPGVYEIDGPIRIGSDTVLTGSEDAIIRVSSSSSQWFTGATGIINPSEYPLKNVEIHGFQIDGNLDELPRSYANYGTGDHNAERLIYLQGKRNAFMENISVHDMTLYDSYSDGLQIAYCNNAQVYNNFVSNCQHSGIFLISVVGANVFKNDVAGITSDCIRLDNCVNTKIFDNVLYSYTGDNLQGQGTNGENGLQIADEGYSHGGGGNKPTHTENIEVFNNTFANTGWHGIWLDSTGKGVTNVYIHDNKFLKGSEIKTEGVSVEGISYNNPPTIEQSKEIFSSIFEVLELEYSTSGRTEQTAEDIPLLFSDEVDGLIAGGVKIVITDIIYIDGVAYIPGVDAVQAQTKAILDPDLDYFTGHIKKIEKNLDVELENGTAYAVFTVKTHWYTVKKNPVTGEKKKSKIKTSTSIFKDSCPVPLVMERPTEAKGILYEYPIHSLAYVPSNGLTAVEYEYDGKNVKHIYMIGERHKNDDGVIYTNFSKVNYWKGDLDHQGEFLYINGSFDPEKLTVTAYTPYESFQVIHFDHIKKDYPDKFYADWLFPSFGLFLILGFGAWYYIRKILY